MKIAAICALIVVIVLSIFAVRGIRKSKQLEESTTGVSTTASSILSEEGRRALEKYKDYEMDGVTLDMPVKDMLNILGDLPKETRSDGWVIYRSENAAFVVIPEEAKDKITFIEVTGGTCMGLTIGRSTSTEVEHLMQAKNMDIGNLFVVPEDRARSVMRCISKEDPSLALFFDFRDGVLTRMTSSIGDL